MNFKNIVNAGMEQISKLDGVGNKIANNVTNKAATKLEEAGARRFGNAIGGGVEGLIGGAATGAVVGGIAGGINEDETVLGGMVKGAFTGAALGGIGGSISGAAHNNSGLFKNTYDDALAIAGKLSKWKTGMGDGISRRVNNSMGQVIRPGSIETIEEMGVKVGEQVNGQMRLVF